MTAVKLKILNLFYIEKRHSCKEFTSKKALDLHIFPGEFLLGTYTLGKVMVLRTVNKQDPYFGGISREEKVLNTRVQYKMS